MGANLNFDKNMESRDNRAPISPSILFKPKKKKGMFVGVNSHKKPYPKMIPLNSQVSSPTIPESRSEISSPKNLVSESVYVHPRSPRQEYQKDLLLSPKSDNYKELYMRTLRKLHVKQKEIDLLRTASPNSESENHLKNYENLYLDCKAQLEDIQHLKTQILDLHKEIDLFSEEKSMLVKEINILKEEDKNLRENVIGNLRESLQKSQEQSHNFLKELEELKVKSDEQTELIKGKDQMIEHLQKNMVSLKQETMDVFKRERQENDTLKKRLIDLASENERIRHDTDSDIERNMLLKEIHELQCQLSQFKTNFNPSRENSFSLHTLEKSVIEKHPTGDSCFENLESDKIFSDILEENKRLKNTIKLLVEEKHDLGSQK